MPSILRARARENASSSSASSSASSTTRAFVVPGNPRVSARDDAFDTFVLPDAPDASIGGPRDE
jgi:hypothetical protein